MKPLPWARGFFRLGWGLALAGAAIGVGRRARAGTSDIVTRLVCPALPPAARAELEARAQVDLTLRSAGGGELGAICDGLTARVTWSPKTGGIFERTVSAPTPAALVDALLVAVAELADESSRAGAKAPAPPPPAEEKKEDEPSPSKEPRREEPSTTHEEGSASEGPSRPIPFGAAVGGVLSSNALGGRGANVGPRAALLLGLPGSITIAAGGAYGFGFGGNSSAVTIRTAEGSLVASTLLGARRSFEIGVGAAVGAVMADAPGFTLSLGETPEPYYAAIARGRYGWTDGRWRISVGPELRFYATPTQIQLDGSVVWEMPTFTAGISLDVATAFSGSLW